MTDDTRLVNTLKEWVAAFMHNSFHETMRFSRETGWSMTQIHTLMIIHSRQARTVSDIGDELGVSNPATSQLLDRMVQEGLIERREDKTDRRVKQISLTEKGLDLIHESINARERWIYSLSEVINGSEQEEIIHALRLLINKVKELGHSDLDECRKDPQG